MTRDPFPLPEARLATLGVTLPLAPTPAGLYVEVARDERFISTAGHGPVASHGVPVEGQLGRSLSVAEGQLAARSTILSVLSSMRQALGSLDQIGGFFHMFVLVSAAPEFREHPSVADGASEMLHQVFGPQVGAHARTAFGVSSLPFGIPVEINLTAFLKPGAM